MGVYETMLCKSIVDGDDLCQITCHMDKVVNINFQCKSRLTALHTAVMCNNVGVVSLLLERGADMTVSSLKKTSEDEYECPLLMAFQQGESHEEMQLLLLRVLKNTSRDTLNSTALRPIARVTHYAMMYSTARIFFAAKQDDCQQPGAYSAGYNPLMFTVVRVGRLEEDVDKCKNTMEKVLQIVDKDSGMLWQRFRPAQLERIGAAKHPHTGCTALGILAFEIMRDRKRCLLEFKDTVQNDTKEREMDARNRQIMAYFSNGFIPCLFVQMLRPMRTALGMSTHFRLGDQRNCGVGQLDAITMNIIFNELVRGIARSETGFKHMLC